jgi:hypothetical protein
VAFPVLRKNSAKTKEASGIRWPVKECLLPSVREGKPPGIDHNAGLNEFNGHPGWIESPTR